MRWLYRGAPPDRVGRVWRALVGYGRPLSTAELFAYCYPALDFNNRQAHWRWMAVRYAAERYGERVEPRTRPLRWQPSQASFWTVEPEQRIYSQVLSASFGRKSAKFRAGQAPGKTKPPKTGGSRPAAAQLRSGCLVLPADAK